MNNKWHFLNDKPIYSQIVEQIKNQIVSGTLAPGDKIDTVREISDSASVNPNTVQRAFTELEHTGLVQTHTTNGRFVTEDKELISSVKKKKINEIVGIFLLEMKNLGYSKEESIEKIAEYEEV